MTFDAPLRNFATRPNVFTAEMEHAIALLRDMRIRLSLFVVDDGHGARTATLAEGLGRLGLVGMPAGSTLVLLHMAPRLAGGIGDANVERLVVDRVRTLISGVAGARPVRMPRVGVAHFQSDRAATIIELIDEAAATLAMPSASGRIPAYQMEGA